MDFLMVSDLGSAGLTSVLSLAAQAKANPGRFSDQLAGRRIGLFFEKPSTRTRVSCEVATVDLGAHPVVLKADEVGLGKRESVEDVARTLDRYLDVLALRVFSHRNLEIIGEHAEAPVINLLSDRSHPCQALADLQTIAEHRQLAGTTVTFVGDGNNVAHSLMIAGGMAGMTIRVVTPPGYEPAADVVAEARELASEAGGEIVVGTDLRELIDGTDVVYTDVWASMGQESEAAERLALFSQYQVDLELFESAAADALFLHCLPAHRDEEVTDAVIEHPRSFVFDQAENRMHAFKGLLLHLDATR
jgi:ornithine carbamoyltransferase